MIIILLMLSSTFVFQVGLVALLLERFRALLMLSALYLTFSVILHSWLVVRAASTQLTRYDKINYIINKLVVKKKQKKTLFLDVPRICGCSTPPDSFGPTAFR